MKNYLLISILVILFISCTNQKIEECANLGETINAQSMPDICCSGLKPMGGFKGGYQGNCNEFPPPSGLNICSDCGNNICDIEFGENKCNCPNDCNN